MKCERARRRGLRALEEMREVPIVAVPDIHIQPKSAPRFSPPPPCIPDPCLPLGAPPPAIPRAPSVGDLPPVFSEERNLSGAVGDDSALRETARSYRAASIRPSARRAMTSSASARYAPGAAASIQSMPLFITPGCAWLIRCVQPTSITREIPPSGHVAGQYAQNDFQFGVHKAPANAPLVWAAGCDRRRQRCRSRRSQSRRASMRFVRLPGRGMRIFGARTVSSDPDWRYVNVRRLMMMIEKAIEVAIAMGGVRAERHLDPRQAAT